jgi:hypothetical protein
MVMLPICLFAAVLATPDPVNPAGSANSVSATAAATVALEAVYGPSSAAGYGSAVFEMQGTAADALEPAALGIYRNFLGDRWERRESAWRSGFRLLYARASAAGDGIIAELHAVKEPSLGSLVELLVDNMEDPAAARAALVGAFDGTDISQLQLYALGDGEQYSGVEIAARSVDGRARFLLLLLD